MLALHHIGYWVDDLGEATAQASHALGVGPFLVHEHVRFDDFTYADGEAVTDPLHFDHSAAFASWGALVIEFGQVHRIDPRLERAYRTGASGLGHVSWVVADLAAESRRLETLGCPLIHTAGSGAVRVAWHQGGPLFPHPIEIHQAGAPILGMHARLSALAADWDGRDLLRPMVPAPPTDDPTGGLR